MTDPELEAFSPATDDLVEGLTAALRTCHYQAEAHREFGEFPELGKYFVAAGEDIYRALGHLLHGDDLAEVWDSSVLSARKRCGLVD